MDGNRHDPKQALSRLFGDAAEREESPRSPFPDAPTGGGPNSRLRTSITRLRILRSQAGAEGLTASATRSLLDELLSALEAVSEALPSDRAED